MQLVWFKRDLRAVNHQALAMALERGPVLPIYIVEPDLWRQPDASLRQWQFVEDSLVELNQALGAAGQPLSVLYGDVIGVFETLVKAHNINAIWSHEETGNAWSYERDKMVSEWCRHKGVPWYEIPGNGVIRRLKSRNGWANNWDVVMARPLSESKSLPTTLSDAPFQLPKPRELGLGNDGCIHRQIGGRQAGLSNLNSFFAHRGRTYQRAMSSPLEGAQACSRISPHLTWGTLSIAEVAQATWVKQTEPRSTQWKRALNAFNGRLHWHCHFIQKLEDEPRIEFEEMHPLYRGVRPLEPDQVRLTAWANGETGLPFVDACMRSLRATGWLNFRMRAMVMAVASYHLWLDWRATGQVLARYFTDYEPGIHWSQVQMQSGTTGINSIRIYNPIKQGYDQDPTGAFTRRWIPELAPISDSFLHEPWRAENAAQVLGKTYPVPIIDPIAAARDAKDKIWAVRKSAGFKEGAARVMKKHASRKATSRPIKSNANPSQLSFPF